MSASDIIAEKFKESFFAALVKRGDKLGWSDGDHKAVELYAKTLTTKCDNVLPSIAPDLIVVVNDVFAFGIALNRLKDNALPPFTFNGERQKWFLELLELKLSEAEKRRAKLEQLKMKRTHKAKGASEAASADNVVLIRRTPAAVAEAAARRKAAQSAG